MARWKYTPEEVGEMARLYVKEEWSLSRIADHLGADKRGVSKALDRNGIKKRTAEEDRQLRLERERAAIDQALST